MSLTFIKREFLTVVIPQGESVEQAKQDVPNAVPGLYPQSQFTVTVESIQDHTPGGFTDAHPEDFGPGEHGLLVGVKLEAIWAPS